MMKEEFETSFSRAFLSCTCCGCDSRGRAGISAMKQEKGLALQDIIAGIFELMQTLELPGPARIYFLDHLAQIECVAP
jgi:hypothetical protein